MTINNDFKQAYTIPEVCKAINMGKTCVYSLINSGELKAKKIRKKTFVLKADLENFLSELADYPVDGGQNNA